MTYGEGRGSDPWGGGGAVTYGEGRGSDLWGGEGGQ